LAKIAWVRDGYLRGGARLLTSCEYASICATFPFAFSRARGLVGQCEIEGG